MAFLLPHISPLVLPEGRQIARDLLAGLWELLTAQSPYQRLAGISDLELEKLLLYLSLLRPGSAEGFSFCYAGGYNATALCEAEEWLVFHTTGL